MHTIEYFPVIFKKKNYQNMIDMDKPKRQDEERS